MLRLNSTIGVLACLLLVCSPAFAADNTKADKSGSKKSASSKGSLVRGYYAIVANEIKLTDDQKSKLEAALKARAEARADWEENHGDKDKQLSDAIKAAKKAKEKDKAKALSDEQKKLRADRDKPEANFKSAFNSLLTAKQRTHLAGFSLYIGTMQRLSKAKLTDEQKAKAKSMALDMGADVPNGDDSKVDKEFRAAFAEKVAQAVLTAEQREALTKKSEKKPDKKADKK